MKNKQNFVSYHYIKFAEKIVAFIAKSMDPDKSCEIIKKLIKCFCDLIQNADVCQTSHAHDDEKLEIHDHHKKTGENRGLVNDDVLIITKEYHISQLIDGLKNIIRYCLQAKSTSSNLVDLSETETNIDE